MHGALNYRVMAIFCTVYKKWLRNMKLQCLKLFIMTKTKKNEFLEDFRELSLVGSLKWFTLYMCTVCIVSCSTAYNVTIPESTRNWRRTLEYDISISFMNSDALPHTLVLGTSGWKLSPEGFSYSLCLSLLCMQLRAMRKALLIRDSMFDSHLKLLDESIGK